jgi:ATP-dependent helicase HrpB
LKARRTEKLGALVLKSETQPVPRDEASAAALAAGIAALGLSRLPWSGAQKQWLHRIAFLRAADSAAGWPDLSDDALTRDVQDWLAPHLLGKTALAEITAETLDAALRGLLPYELSRRLALEAPTHFDAPTGNRHVIDYESEGAPLLSIRVQELFGLTAHPTLANGRLPLTLQLLSPAHRPIQITRDLPGFWAGSWSQVKSEMKGRYPRHFWPEDPASALPTSRAKPRGA